MGQARGQYLGSAARQYCQVLTANHQKLGDRLKHIVSSSTEGDTHPEDNLVLNFWFILLFQLFHHIISSQQPTTSRLLPTRYETVPQGILYHSCLPKSSCQAKIKTHSGDLQWIYRYTVKSYTYDPDHSLFQNRPSFQITPPKIKILKCHNSPPSPSFFFYYMSFIFSRVARNKTVLKTAIS